MFRFAFTLVLPGFAMTATAKDPLIVAHRGASIDAPENTRAAFRLAFEPKADAVEGDFYLTADGIDTQANLSVLTPAFVKAIRDAKLERHCRTVDGPVAAKVLAELGVDSIATNHPAFRRAAVK